MSHPSLPPFSPDYTFGDLEHLLLPPFADLSHSSATAPYTNKHPAPSPPQFCLQDDPLIAEQLTACAILFGAPLDHSSLRHRKTPAGCLQLWNLLEAHIRFVPCTREGWVAIYATYIIAIVSVLASEIWPKSSCTYWPPSQSYSQRGDCHIAFSIRDAIQIGIAAEWKTSRVLQMHIQEIVSSMLLPEGEAEDWAGIVKKIGLHMGTTYMDLTKSNEDRIADPSARPLVGVHYGLVFSGQACVVAQYLLASSPPGFLPIPGVAVSHAVQITPGGPAPVPIFALILGVLAQTSAAATFRDPAVDPRLKGTWFNETVPALQLAARFVPDLRTQPSAPPPPPPPSTPGPLPPPPPPSGLPAPQSQSGAGGSSAGGAISSGAASSFPNDMCARGYAQQQVLLHFDLPGAHTTPLLLMSISRDYVANRYCSPSPSSSLASSSAPSSVVSTPPSSPEPKSEYTLPHLKEGRTTTSHLILEPTIFHSGHFATVHCGQFSLDNQPSSRIILKSYPTQYFPRLVQELDIYAALAPLAVIVPRLCNVLAPLNLAWAGLVLEDAGTELGNSSQSWDEVDLTHEDRRRLYGALTEIHSAGVIHGDLTPRNVVRRSRGALCLVDFGQSTLHHICSGARCPELFALHKALAL
ncbi:hypothetical protein C8R44DRAFT_807108 [Mycena epipterygia]|nr:hypothetical protein C8R44DRAFT_807108 [Mycena epipterygia]